MKRYRMEGEGEVDSINLANVLVLLSRGSFAAAEEADQGLAPHYPARVFECKTCNRRFTSFQALGGHRASHKKPRLAGGQPPAAGLARPRVHECSICGVEFSIGQALGGHMRRHRAAAAEALRHALAEKKADVVVVGGGGGDGRGEVLCLDFDLNLSPPDNDVDLPGLSLGLGVPMVDCFY